MPRALDHFRTLQKDFCSWMERHGPWPLLHTFSTYFVKQILGYDKAYVTAMKRGAAVPEKYGAALAELLKGKAALDAFLMAKGAGASTDLSTDQIINLIAGPVMRGMGYELLELDMRKGIFIPMVVAELHRRIGKSPT